MIVCPNCSKENIDGAKFCAHCGTALADTCPNCGAALPGEVAFCPSCGTALGAEATEERRLVTVLFADLVGFTAESDEADPEDVRARLTPYHQQVREEIEAFGGTLEKLIGDGVMAVFGVPTAHEDDPERAVRVGLRIQEAVDKLNEEHEGLDLAVRIGINTGEAAVSKGGQGERIVGDVVNTASRLESIAPPGGVVVGEATHRATELLIEYEGLDPVQVKGKAALLSVWRAIEPRGRFGIDASIRAPTPFLGRDFELGLLTENFRRVVDDGSLQLVTIAADPGVGKSRLVNEFFRWIDDQPEIVWWRQGRCLPYGEGITFWALGEIVKGQAGIRESDSPEIAAQKLATAVAALTEDELDREWIAAQLGPLVGAGIDVQGGDRAEAFTAWRRFLEGLANVRPLIIVIEDLHWADGALVEFLGDLLLWSTDVPILVICTARPELYETHPGWGREPRNSVTISLAPLSDDHIAELLSALLERTVLPAPTQQALLDRAGGNPLYAEEFARMLEDRGLSDAGAVESIPVPETVQALIGSRLDLLSDAESEAIEDAAVVGKVFWEGALRAVSGDGELRGALRQLVAREWIRPVRNSSIEGEQEYAFWHALTRDVAYGRIARKARIEKHRIMAEWIESAAGERVSDHAELLAHHYASALEIAEAAGEETEAFRPQAARALVMAGDRALRLDLKQARGYYQQALDLLDEVDETRPAVLIKLGTALADENLAAQIELFQRASELALARGDRVTAGQALRATHRAKWMASGIGVGTDELDRAIELLEGESASAQLAEAYISRSADYMFRGELDEQLAWSEKGIEIADALELGEARSRGLSMRGIARVHLGDPEGGMADLRESLAVAEAEASNAQWLISSFVNLADHTWIVDGPAAGLEIFQRGIEVMEMRGMEAWWAKAETMWVDWDLGEWDRLMATADELLGRWGEEPVQFVPWAKSSQARVHLWRGNTAAAAELQAQYLPALREIGDLQLLSPGLVVAARTDLALGNLGGTSQLMEEFIEITEGKSPIYRGLYATDAIRLLVDIGDVARAEQLAGATDAIGWRNEIGLSTAQALLAEAEGDYETALLLFERTAHEWAEFGHKPETALALYGAGRSAAKLSRPQSAATYFATAQELLAELGAQPTIDEIDGIAAEVTAG